MLPVVPEPREGYESAVFARDQKEYHPLPANTNGTYVETKWELTEDERADIFVNGQIWLTIKTFGEPLQPIRMGLDRMLDEKQ